MKFLASLYLDCTELPSVSVQETPELSAAQHKDILVYRA